MSQHTRRGSQPATVHDVRQPDTVMASYACGCRVEGYSTGGQQAVIYGTGVTIIFCALHTAAPDLLAALEECVRVIEYLYRSVKDSVPVYMHDAADDARAALVKAKGTTT